MNAGQYHAVSAGRHPAGYLHPKSIETLSRHGIDVGEPKSQLWDEFDDIPFDYVIKVCEHAAGETRPAFMGTFQRSHWSTPDPAKAQCTEAEIEATFDEPFFLLKIRIEQELV